MRPIETYQMSSDFYFGSNLKLDEFTFTKVTDICSEETVFK